MYAPTRAGVAGLRQGLFSVLSGAGASAAACRQLELERLCRRRTARRPGRWPTCRQARRPSGRTSGVRPTSGSRSRSGPSRPLSRRHRARRTDASPRSLRPSRGARRQPGSIGRDPPHRAVRSCRSAPGRGKAARGCPQRAFTGAVDPIRAATPGPRRRREPRDASASHTVERATATTLQRHRRFAVRSRLVCSLPPSSGRPLACRRCRPCGGGG